MIAYRRYLLENGLTVILHKDESTPLVTVNVLYKVGSRNENPSRTGFAHLFEHLMFGGSENVPDYDTPMQTAGGDSNAFTNSDLTNFYDVLPAENLETALWLESDRMLKPNFSQQSLDVQKKVVVEEFKETSINEPYGDMWHELSSLAYKEHPYKWPTIGLVPEHIELAKLEEVEQFFYNYYRPNNAVLIVAGNFLEIKTQAIIEQWFGNIPAGEILTTPIVPEPEQARFRTKTLTRSVPSDAFYLAFHMPERGHKDFIAIDLLSDILSGGRSSRLYKNLLKGSGLFSSISAYISGTIDPGLFIIEAKLLDSADMEKAKQLVWAELEKLKTIYISRGELQKVKNGMISAVAYSELSITTKAINLAHYEMLGDVSLINAQEPEIDAVQVADLHRVANEILNRNNCSELVYLKADTLRY